MVKMTMGRRGGAERGGRRRERKRGKVRLILLVLTSVD